MARRYFGTDGVAGVVGADLTPELVEKVGKAATLWAGGGRVLVGRDTRASGPELEDAVARGIAAAGGTAALGGVLPTPAVALLAERPRRRRLRLAQPARSTTASSSSSTAAQARRRAGGGDRGAVRRGRPGERRDRGGRRCAGAVPGARARALRLRPHRTAHRCRLRQRRVHGDRSARVRAARSRGARDRRRAGRLEHQRRLWRDRPEALAPTRHGPFASTSGVAFDGDGDRVLAVDERGEPVDGDQILAVLALHLGVELVAVTVMTNLGFHRLMAERRRAGRHDAGG